MSPRVKKPEPASTNLSAKDLNRFLDLRHIDPHALLGMHPQGEGVLVRVFRPDASAVSILLEGGEERLLAPTHPSGLFEIFLADKKEIPPYQVKVSYPGKKVFTYWDPYAFWPTLGEMDIYLLGEGNHQKLHEKMGAHFREWQGVKGFSFVVWAPSAKGV